VSQQLAAPEREPPRARRVRLTPKPISSSRTPRSFFEEMERAEAALAQFIVRSDESCMRCYGPRRRITMAA
jgi:hypothetical protein